MTRFIKTLSLSLLLFSGQWAVAQTDEQAIKAAHADYEASIANDKSEEAIKYLDSRTKKYYADILKHVLSSDSVEVEGLSFSDKTTILSIRLRASREEILNFTDHSLLVYAINNGMIGSKTVSSSLENVKVKDSFATAELVVNGLNTNVATHFYKEEGQWKVNLTNLFAFSDAVFDQFIGNGGLNEHEMILSVLEETTGKKPTNEVWRPISK